MNHDPNLPLTLLGGLCPAEFLHRHWHKEPLLVRGALPGYRSPVAPDELAGLACEEEVESRLILEKDGARPWQLERGPFPEERFARLPPTHWTLLVQEINKHVPEFALLQDAFGFIPNWRLDDVMVSYAPPFGTVGPHADNYDVFLIQGLGRRRWQINRRPPGPEDLIPGLDLRIMRHFETEDEWVLEPGDMLYLPPGVAHWGVALEDCMTISVGFRAPTEQEVLAAWAADVVAGLDPERFYSDPELTPAAHPGLLSSEARAHIRALLRTLVADEAAMDRWFGRFITDVRPGHFVPEPERPVDAAGLRRLLKRHGELWRSEYCRWACYRDGEVVRLFVAGDEHTLPAAAEPALTLLAGTRRFDTGDIAALLERPGILELMVELYNGGCLYFPDE